MGLCGLMPVTFLTLESKATELALLVTVEKRNCKHDLSGTGCSKLPPKASGMGPFYTKFTERFTLIIIRKRKPRRLSGLLR